MPLLSLVALSQPGRYTFDRFPIFIGGDTSADLVFVESQLPGRAAVISKNGSGANIVPVPGVALTIDGTRIKSAGKLTANEDYAIEIAGQFLVARFESADSGWAAQIDSTRWNLYTATNAQFVGEISQREIPAYVAKYPADAPGLMAAPANCRAGFPLLRVAEMVRSLPALKPEPPPLPEIDPVLPPLGEGEHTCPTCWLRFGSGDVMSIATHDHLRGDPLLGPDAKLRFIPTRFNDRGQALDSMGLACLDSACPHCRRKLPPGFLDIPNHIVSIVGAPAAGKSYYISTLIKGLASTLYRDFKVTFRDGDPSGNAVLNDMKNRLFSAQTPEEAFLLKTVLGGGITYERLPRNGREVDLPKPFVYEISPLQNADDCRSIILYDNAGEHFKPNISLDDSPGALHVASSDAILFLIDPTTNPAFRQRLRDRGDPQLKLNAIDEQDTLLAEMGVRIRLVKGLPARQRARMPLAVILGKCDVWEHLLPGPPLSRPIRDGKLDHAAIRDTSERIRDLLLDIEPSLVAVADSVSEEVVYFPASSLGHAPGVITNGPYTGKFAPDPAKLKPRFVEIPFLWALSRFAPSLVPVCD